MATREEKENIDVFISSKFYWITYHQDGVDTLDIERVTILIVLE